MSNYAYYLSEYYLYHKNYEKALPQAINLLHFRNSAGRGTCMGLGTKFLYAGRYDEALKIFEKVLEYYPDYIEAYCNAGVACEKKGRTDKAIENYLKAIEIEPRNVQAHYNLSVAYWTFGRWGEVVSELKKVLELDPGHGEAKKYLPQAQRFYEESGRIK